MPRERLNSVDSTFSEAYDPDDSEYEPDELDSETSFNSRLSDSINSMGPPPPISQEAMALRREKRDYEEKISKQEAEIYVLTMIRDRHQKQIDELTKKNDELTIKNEVLQQRVANLTSQLPIQGGNNKRIKNVSKHSTASKRNATRRHSSKR